MSSPEAALRFAEPGQMKKGGSERAKRKSTEKQFSEERSYAMAFITGEKGSEKREGAVEARRVALQDLREILDLTGKGLAEFDEQRFADFLKMCVRSVEMSTQASTSSAVRLPGETQDKVTERFTQERKDPRAIAVDMYVWLIDTLSLIDVAVQQKNELALQEGLREAHESVGQFLQEAQKAAA